MDFGVGNHPSPKAADFARIVCNQLNPSRFPAERGRDKIHRSPQTEAQRMATVSPDQIIGGRYRIIKKIGAGGMGAVFLAENIVQGGRAAIKVLTIDINEHPELAVRFQNEARAANETGHPGIVPVYDSGQEAGMFWLAMPLLVGEPLSARLARFPAVGLGMEGFRLMGHVASALTAAHAAGIVHRDLKPANIFLVDDPMSHNGERAMTLDFGVAKLTTDNLTKKGAVLGTPVYMALEQFRDSAAVDGKADVFSLGVICYQVLSGRLPHYGGTHYEVMGKRMMDPVPPLDKLVPSLPGPVVDLVMAMLAKEPADRPTMLVVDGEIRRTFGMPPPRQSGYHAVVPPSPATIDAPEIHIEERQPTDDLPPRRTEDLASGALRAMHAAAAGTPSEQRAAGEISPPSAVAVPLTAPSLSSMPSVPMPLPPFKAGPEDSTARPAPQPPLPSVLASPTAPTTVEPVQRKRRYRTVAGLAAILAVTTGLVVELRQRSAPPKQPAVAQPPQPSREAVQPAVPQPAIMVPPSPAPKPPEQEPSPSPARLAVQDEPTPPHRKTPTRKCEPQDIVHSCIISPGLTMQQRDSIFSALQHGDIKLCAKDSLILTGIPNHPHIKIAPSYLPKEQSVLLYGLRAIAGEYPAEIEVRCRAQ